MREDFEKQYHDVESKHWWFKSRRNYILDLLKGQPRNSKVLDIGCSSGILLNELKETGFDLSNLYGIDISPAAIENCKANGVSNAFLMDAQDITLSEKFDVIIASDCLEHLENDKKALNNWYELLNEGGLLLVFVPAFMSLWSNHDEVNMHQRRYTLGELESKLGALNVRILKSSYWNFFLFLPVFVYRWLAKFLPSGQKSETGDLTEPPAVVNSALTALLNSENKMLKFINFPVGVSAFCIAKKA